MREIRLTYVMPAFNEAVILERNARRLAHELTRWGIAELLIVENGSTDATWRVARALASGGLAVPTRAIRTSQRGLGHAFHEALKQMSFTREGQDHCIALGAADLPFGFSDLRAARPLLEGGASLILGSKAHPESRGVPSAPRRVSSLVYRLLRQGLLGMRTRDCQGTIFVRRSLADALDAEIRSRDYFYTTELVYLAERWGVRPIELPVRLRPNERRSSVGILRDGSRMFQQLVALRLRRGEATQFLREQVAS